MQIFPFQKAKKKKVKKLGRSEKKSYYASDVDIILSQNRAGLAIYDNLGQPAKAIFIID